MDSPETPSSEPSTSRERFSRRHAVKAGMFTAGALAVPSLAGKRISPAQARAHSGALTLAPRYYPLASFTPEVDLRGKLAVVTGASRGNGRAVGEALAALGVDVIGTSRNPVGVPNPPAFPLLQLDVADPHSVLFFTRRLTAHRTFRRHGHVDILVNNAGRFVFGSIIPLTAADTPFFLTQRELAVRTLYTGHVLVTSAMLPLLARQRYARVVFTVSIASYYTGATMPGSSGIDAYTAGKAALRTYANNLGTALQQAGSNILVSTVNPYVMNTALAEHPHPIYTQPVNNQGLSDTDPSFNAVVTGIRQLLANGQPPSRVGTTYAQLLSMRTPEPNVAVASPNEPFASEGANALIEPQLITENAVSAIPIVSA